MEVQHLGRLQGQFTSTTQWCPKDPVSSLLSIGPRIASASSWGRLPLVGTRSPSPPPGATSFPLPSSRGAEKRVDSRSLVIRARKHLSQKAPGIFGRVARIEHMPTMLLHVSGAQCPASPTLDGGRFPQSIQATWGPGGRLNGNCRRCQEPEDEMLLSNQLYSL